MGPEGTNAMTRLRRAQRKHSQQSYLAMKAKLLGLVRPLPKAIYVSDLELFRADLFTKTQELPEQPEPEVQPIEALDQTKDRCISASVTCGWCGTWVPLPNIKSYPKVLEIDASIDAAREYCGQDIEAVCEKLGANFLGQVQVTVNLMIAAASTSLIHQVANMTSPIFSHPFCVR